MPWIAPSFFDLPEPLVPHDLLAVHKLRRTVVTEGRNLDLAQPPNRHDIASSAAAFGNRVFQPLALKRAFARHRLEAHCKRGIEARTLRFAVGEFFFTPPGHGAGHSICCTGTSVR